MNHVVLLMLGINPFCTLCSLYTDILLFFFSKTLASERSEHTRMSTTPLRWQSINPVYIFYHTRSTDWTEEKIEGLWTGYTLCHVHLHCTWLAESVSEWVKRDGVSWGLSPLSGLICQIVNSVGQCSFTFVRIKSGKGHGISETSSYGNHAWANATTF